MHLLDLFFEGGEAIMVIFKLGFIPNEEDFKEFSESDYVKYHKEVGETEGKMYRFVEGQRTRPWSIWLASRPTLSQRGVSMRSTEEADLRRRNSNFA